MDYLIQYFKKRYVWIGLYLLGLVHWAFFVRYQHPTFTAFDWPLIHQWLDVIRQALLTGKTPYHASFFADEFRNGKFLLWGDRFFAIPYLTLSPQVLLLYFLNIPVFMMLQLLLIYSIAFWGACKWIEKLNLSSTQAIFFLILFSFNGVFVGRMAVGHLQNVSYFLVPCYFWFLYKFIEKENFSSKESLLAVMEYAFFLFFVLLQGSLHVFHQMMLIGFFLLLFYPKRIFWYIGSVVLAFIFCTYFIWPNLWWGTYMNTNTVDRIVFYGYGCTSRSAHISLISAKAILVKGNEIFYHLWESLTRVYTANDGKWEYSLYISQLGVMLVLGSGAMAIKKYKLSFRLLWRRYRFLFVAMMVAFLSVYSVSAYFYNFLQLFVPIPIPIVDRLPTRLLLYPFLLMILLATLGFDDLFAKIPWKKLGFFLQGFALASLALFLMIHSYGWRVAQTEKYNVPTPNVEPNVQEFYTVIYDRTDDEAYKRSVRIAYSVSTVAVVIFGFYYFHLRKKSAKV